MADLLVVTGPPGAGKSTVCGVLAQRHDPSALVSSDDFFAMLRRGYIAPWTAEAHDQNAAVVGAAAAAAGRLVTGGLDVVFDGVIGPWFLERFVAASGLGEIQYALLLPPADICVERVASRSGHGLTDLDATRHMHAEFARASVAERHIIRTPAGTEALAEEIIARADCGDLVRPARG